MTAPQNLSTGELRSLAQFCALLRRTATRRISWLSAGNRSCISTGMQRKHTQLLLDEIAFVAWIAQAGPGESLEYFRGFLPLDSREKETLLCNPDDRPRLIALANRAMQAADLGLCHLVQKRFGPFDYAYRAVARSRSSAFPRRLSQLLHQEAAQ